MKIYSVKIGGATLIFQGDKVDSGRDLPALETALTNVVNFHGNDWDRVATALTRNNPNNFLVATQHYYNLEARVELSQSNWAYKVRVYDGSGITTKYNGSLSGFATLLKQTNWNDYAGKALRFAYDGGSDFGAIRLVKVNSYSNGNIYTVDLVSNTPKTYSVSKIKTPEIVTL